jgi:hypothetical protein
MADLYDEDIVLWSERQAELLRQHAATARVNDTIDWTNIIEEIESVGSEQIHAVTSLLRQALIHMLKARVWPLSRHVPHWEAEARVFQASATDRFVPSMLQRIDLARIFGQAVRGLPTMIDGQPPLPVPAVCEWTLDQLLSEDDAAP